MPQTMQNDSIVLASKVTPSPRQIEWQKLEFYAFCHFGTNTFTGKEWGDGNAAPSLFNPKKLDAEQWVKEIKNAGMRALILTCKHHDGFCLWPSKYTDYSVKNSPYKNGKGDVVKEVSDACRKHGIKFGVYLSPWDRHEKTYGQGKAYDDYFVNQLTELAENYGDVFCFWFDGACGEGKNGKKQVYDWNRYFTLIREKQPNAVLNICGVDVRWCGNEAGKYRSAEWSVVPYSLCNQDYTAEHSQQADDKSFSKKFDSTTKDLGSRDAIDGISDFIWYPCETDVSIRPGWFYHKSQDFRVKSVKKLMDIYFGTVGGNSAFLLNIPPDKNGLISKADVRVLRKLGDRLRAEFSENKAVGASVTASTENGENRASNVICENGYWKCEDGDEAPEITLDFKERVKIDKIVLCENIETGQQIESFEVYAKTDNGFTKIAEAETVGAKRICCFEPVKTKKIKVKITSYRRIATLKKIELYCK